MNSRGKIIKIIDYLMEIGVMAIVFFAPLFFSFFYRINSVFLIDKDTFFKIFVLLLLILFIIRFFVEKKITFYINLKQLFIVLLFFLSVIISTLFSINSFNSFWGSYLRQDGLITHIFYLLFFFILIFYIKDSKRIERIVSVILLSSFFVSLFGALQWFGLDIADLFQGKHNPGQRVISTIGQPMLLGNYLLLVIFLTVYKLFSLISRENTPFNKGGVGGFLRRHVLSLRGAPHIAGRRSNLGEPNEQDFKMSFFSFCFSPQFFPAIAYSFLLLSQLLCLAFTYSRGAWLGFISGMVFAVFLYFYIQPENKFKKIIKFLSVCLLLTILLTTLFYFINKNTTNNAFIERLKSIQDINRGSLAVRLRTWNAALIAISKRPLVGYGQENQYEVFKEYYRPDWAIYESINSLPDRAHNLFLDILLSGGIFQLIVYFLLLFYILIKGINKIRKSEGREKWLLFFLLVSIFSYHFALLASFPSIESNILFWAYVAFVFLLVNDFKGIKILDLSNFKKTYYYILIIVAIYGAAGAVYFGFLTVNGYRADYYYRLAVLAAGKKDYLAMYNNFITAINLNSREDFYKRQYIKSVLNFLEANDSEVYRNQALDYLENAITLKNSDSYYNILSQARLFTILGAYKDKKYFSEAEKLYFKLNKINPFLPEPYKDRGKMYMYAGDYKKALTIFKLGLSVIPDENNPELNMPEVWEHKNEVENFRADIYNNMAYSYFKLNDYGSSINYYKKIIAINPYNLESYKMVANNYYLSHNLDMAIWYYKRGAMLDSANGEWYFSLAVIYKERGNKVNAGEYAVMALKLSPKDKQIQEFIEKLK